MLTENLTKRELWGYKNDHKFSCKEWSIEVEFTACLAYKLILKTR